MQTHVTTRMRGPVSRTRGWWSDWPLRGTSVPGLTKQASRESTMDYRKYDQPAREPEIRVELVARVRREIAEGTYETPEKLEIALERMLNCWERAD